MVSDVRVGLYQLLKLGKTSTMQERSVRSFEIEPKRGTFRTLSNISDGLLCNFTIKEYLAKVFSCEFCQISKNTLFYRTPLVAVSAA